MYGMDFERMMMMMVVVEREMIMNFVRTSSNTLHVSAGRI
jgi:hypothetical protein